MHTIISYDIRNDKRRRRVVKVLKGVGFRVQYSVFEAHLSIQKIQDLTRRLIKVIDTEEDSVRIYRLCGDCAGHICMMGVGDAVKEVDVIIV